MNLGKPGSKPGPISRLCREERLVEVEEEVVDERLVERELEEELLQSHATWTLDKLLKGF